MKGVVVRVFDEPNCQYDVILERDFLQQARLDIQFSTNTVKWMDCIIDMKPPRHFANNDNIAHTLYFAEDEVLSHAGLVKNDHECLASVSTQIMDAKYERVDQRELSQTQDYISANQREALHVASYEYK